MSRLIIALTILRPDLLETIGYVARRVWLGLAWSLWESSNTDSLSTAFAVNKDRLQEQFQFLSAFLSSAALDWQSEAGREIVNDAREALQRLKEAMVREEQQHTLALYEESLAYLEDFVKSSDSVCRNKTLGPRLNLAEACLDVLVALEEERANRYANVMAETFIWFADLPDVPIENQGKIDSLVLEILGKQRHAVPTSA